MGIDDPNFQISQQIWVNQKIENKFRQKETKNNLECDGHDRTKKEY